MELPPHYADLLDGESVESWPLYAYLPEQAGYLSAAEAETRIRTETGLRIDVVRPVETRDFAPDAHWELEIAVRLHERDEPWWIRAFIAPSEPLDHEHLDWDGFTDAERDESLRSRWEVGIAAMFGEYAAEDYHIVLKLLAALCPTMVAVYDSASYRVHSGAWAIDAARSAVPPPCDALFSVHTVYPQGDDEGKSCWVHTHGLLRAGCIELEALEIPEVHVDLIADFLAQIGAQFLDLGVPDPDTTFTVGEKLDLLWLPWEESITRVPEGHLGTSPDRDETHDIPSGVLFVPGQGVRKRRYIGLSSCVPTLERNPIYYVSPDETDRASQLAREKLGHFGDLLGRFAGQDQWSFTVKLGFESGSNDPDTPSHEHLWFEVHGLRGETVEGTLLNEPYFIQSMHEGQRGTHSLDRLTDWTVYCPHGTFSPDRLYHLLRIVNASEKASGR